MSAKVMAWRLIRDECTKVGVGGEWPAWSALNRNPNTGKFLPNKPFGRELTNEEEIEKAAAMDLAQDMRPSKPDPKAILGITGDPRELVAAEIETRSEPKREHAPV